MKVTNVSARLHHVGEVSIAPLETVEIDDAFANSINKAELVPIEAEPEAEPARRGRPPKALGDASE